MGQFLCEAVHYFLSTWTEVRAFLKGLIIRKLCLGFSNLPELAVQGLYSIGRVNNCHDLILNYYEFEKHPCLKGLHS